MLFPKKYQQAILIFLLVVISLIMLTYSVKRWHDSGLLKKVVLEATTPLSRIFNESIHHIRGTWQQYLFLINLDNENKRLQKANAFLANQLLQYQDGYLEAQRLQRLLSLRDQVNYPTIAARVIDRNFKSMIKTILINRGSRHGVEVGMPVMADQGVVGRIVETSWHVSRVLLLMDENSNVDAMIQRTRTEGILQGAGPWGCQLKYVANIEDIKAGDTVITSGMSGLFPKGLLLGMVTHLNKKEGGLFQKIEVAPAADIRRVEEVLVLTKADKK